MKTKIIILAAMIAAAVSAQAQYGSEYYHRTGDTVYNKTEIGFYNWWEFEQLIQDRDVVEVKAHNAYYPVTMMQYFTIAPIRIVGIAGCPLNAVNTPYADTTFRQEYFYLFDHENDDIIYKDRLAWNFRDPHRTLVLPVNWPYEHHFDSCCVDFYDEFATPLYEYYFDSAITVADSFFVGWSGASFQPPFTPGTMPLYYVALGTTEDKEACDDLDLGYGNTPHHDSSMISTCGAIPVFDYWTCPDTAINTNPQDDYTWLIRRGWGTRERVLVYPLIEVDTTVPPAYMCEPVQNFQATVLDTGSGCVFFTWDDFYHYTYCEVEYYAVERGYSSRVTTTVTGSNMLHVCGLDSTLTYFARIHAYCDTSKIETEWSGWVNFTFPHSNPPQGIATEPTLLDRYTHVMPNPAADKVVVTSELGLRRIEVYNARGILVYSEPTGYSSRTIDLHGWPSGQYMMIIETREGKTAKKLVVQR